jgi:hypothetical protein
MAYASKWRSGKYMAVKKLVKGIRGFDPFDAAYLYDQGLRGKDKHANRLKELWRNFLTFFYPLRFLSCRTTQPQASQIVFFWKSNNQRDALQALLPAFYGHGLKVFEINASLTGRHKFGLNILHMLMFYFLFFGMLASKFRTLIFRSEGISFRLIVNTYFYFYCALITLRNFKGLVMFANDHSAAPRSFFRGAAFLGLPTAYIQHAAVTEVFPPLAYDYAFLDGKDAVTKYGDIATAKGVVTTTRMYDYGNPKLDKFFDLRVKRQRVSVVRLGIAIGLADRCELIALAIQKLSQYSSGIILIRSHPRLKLTKLQERLLLDAGAKVNIQQEGSLLDFLGSIDVMLAGQSSIHMEAVASGVVSYCVDFGSPHEDYYGFIRQGVAARLVETSFQDVFDRAELEQNLKLQAESLRHYLSNDRYENGAADMIAKEVKGIVNSLDRI